MNINIAICTDNNYAMPSGVLIASICENTPSHIIFHLLHDNLFTYFQQLLSVVSNYDAELLFYNIDDSLVDCMPVGKYYQPDRITKATYYRLLLAKVLPETLTKVLYLDSDIICAASLIPLWNTDINDVPLAAVLDTFYGSEDNYKEGRVEEFGENNYFNAGVLLINLEYWRQNSILDQFNSIIEEKGRKIIFHDQDVLNYTFMGQVKYLDLNFNAYDAIFHKTISHPVFPIEQINYARKNPVLVHFSSDMKPWIKSFRHPYTKLFLRYKKNTIWKSQRLSLKPSYSLNSKLINLLVRLNMHRYNGDYLTIKEISLL